MEREIFSLTRAPAGGSGMSIVDLVEMPELRAMSEKASGMTYEDYVEKSSSSRWG